MADTFPPSTKLHAETIQLSDNNEANVSQLNLDDGLSVLIIEFNLNKPTTLFGSNDHSDIQFSCLVSGEVTVATGSKKIALTSGGMLVTYVPKNGFELSVTPGTRYVEVRVSVERLKALTGDAYPAVMEKICKEGSWQPIGYTFENRQAVNELVNLIMQPHLLQIKVYSATLNLIAVQLDACTPADQHNLPEHTYHQLQLARDLLLADLSNAPTMREISQTTGLNPIKLKRGFKQLFGETIYAFFLKHRMDEAKVMLEKHSVTETAVSLGYSNVSHFSSAFKKQHGMLPSELKRLLH